MFALSSLLESLTKGLRVLAASALRSLTDPEEAPALIKRPMVTIQHYGWNWVERDQIGSPLMKSRSGGWSRAEIEKIWALKCRFLWVKDLSRERIMQKVDLKIENRREITLTMEMVCETFLSQICVRQSYLTRRPKVPKRKENWGQALQTQYYRLLEKIVCWARVPVDSEKFESSQVVLGQDGPDGR